MKKFILLILTTIATIGVNAQELKFEVKGMKDTTIFLANYLGPKLYYADTAYSKNGIVKFDGSKHPTGLYAVITPGVKYFEVVIDNQEPEVYMVVNNVNDMVGSMEVKKSKNNKVFYDYIMYMTKKKNAGTKLNNEFATADDARKEEIKAEMKQMSKEIYEGQKAIYEANKDQFIGLMVLMSMEVQLPDPPKDANGVVTDSNYVYNYYIEHYWDGVPFKNPAIVRTPVYHNKLDKFFSQQGVIQIPDSITKQAKIIIDQMDWVDQDNKVFQYTVHHITQKYESSKIMGMDKVFVFMGQNYYCEPNNHAYWMSEENQEKLCIRVDDLGKVILGNYAPMLILTDTTEKNWINFYQIDAPYTILYFWDPNCGHCKKTTPKLQTLYEKKFKERGVEIYAVGKATGDDFEDWKKFIRTNNLSFINVGLTKNIYNQALEDPRPLLKHTTLESLNYSDTYDIYSTPRIFILDKDKKMIFKQLSIGQLEEIIDNLTGHKDDVKIFPKEDPENGPGGGDEDEDEGEGDEH